MNMMINFKETGIIFSLEVDDTWTYEDFNRIVLAIFPRQVKVCPVVDKVDREARDVCDPDLAAQVEKKKDPKKGFYWTAARDRILRDNFEALGPGGIYDKSLLPGFSLHEIRDRCISLKLLDQYGIRLEKQGSHGADKP